MFCSAVDPFSSNPLVVFFSPIDMWTDITVFFYVVSIYEYIEYISMYVLVSFTQNAEMVGGKRFARMI